MVITYHGIELRPPPLAAFDCKPFGCSCAGMGKYYDVSQATGFGCAPVTPHCGSS